MYKYLFHPTVNIYHFIFDYRNIKILFFNNILLLLILVINK